MDHIEISANNGATEPWRLVRLERVVGYIQAVSDHVGFDMLSGISRLHDHKGILHVEWLKSPSAPETAVVLKAWRSSVGDGSDNVEHSVREKQFAG